MENGYWIMDKEGKEHSDDAVRVAVRDETKLIYKYVVLKGSVSSPEKVQVTPDRSRCSESKNSSTFLYPSHS